MTLQATPDMNTAVMCAFRDNSKLLGYTAPTKYQVFEEETPRLPVKASIDQPECGFDNTGWSSLKMKLISVLL